MADLVLIHMACAGAWAWGRVPEALHALGHRSCAPDLDLSAGQTPSSHAAAVAGSVPGGTDVVLVGHSYGGMVLPPLADLLGDHVLGLVALDGFMPGDGDSAFAIRPPELAALRRAQAVERGDGLWPPPAAGRDDPDWMRRLVPMPLSAFEAPVSVAPRMAALPGTFIHCTRSDMGEQAARARRRGWEVAAVDASHFLPLTRPERCAELIAAAAERMR